MPKYKGGFDIPSFKESYEKMGLSKRISLKSSEDGDINQIWKDTRSNFVEHETLIERYHSKNSAKQALCDIQSERAQSHFFGLESQGLPAKAVVENIDSRNILAWSGFVDGLPETLFNFARRAFQQQLPTAANLFRWKRSQVQIALSADKKLHKRTNICCLIARPRSRWNDSREDTTQSGNWLLIGSARC